MTKSRCKCLRNSRTTFGDAKIEYFEVEKHALLVLLYLPWERTPLATTRVLKEFFDKLKGS
jgi:hypothetical protein